MEIIVTITLLDLVLILLCGLLMLFFNELEDKSVRNGWTKYKQFLNKNLSANNKWKIVDGKRLKFIPTYWKFKIIFNFKFPKQWYYFTVYPEYVERFYLSSMLFVFTTDGEHLFQFMKFRFIELGLLIITWQVMLAWIVGKSIMQFIKEKFLKWLH